MEKSSCRLAPTIFLLALLQALAALPGALAQEKAPKKSAQTKAQEIDTLMRLYHDYGQFNGSVLVAEGGKVILRKGYGMANMEWDIPNGPDTKFRLGSITKQFTAMLILQLMEQGKLTLDSKLGDALPYYRKDTGAQVTIHHLLTHTSGIPSYTERPDLREFDKNSFGAEEFAKKYCSGDLQFAPGSKFHYNNSGYFLLGAIIEQITGKKYEEVLQERIFDPLEMKGTGYDHYATILKHRASGYQKTPNGYRNAAYLDMSIPYSAGSLYSTVNDLYLWDRALYTEKLLSTKSKELMFKPFLNDYAYGWDVRQVPAGQGGEEGRVISHGGGINGFNTLIVRLANQENLIVLLNNTGGTKLAAMSKAIQNILYDKPYEVPKPSITEALWKIIMEKGADGAVAQYREWKKNNPNAYDFGEPELNTLGYQLLEMKKIREAIAIFQLNVEAYPQSFNTYDSLGEAYMAAGEKELAIKNYERSLELNPLNTNAVERLKKLREQ